MYMCNCICVYICMCKDKYMYMYMRFINEASHVISTHNKAHHTSSYYVIPCQATP